MSEETIKEIFCTIAINAINNGVEIRLEKGQNKSESNVLGGSFSQSCSDYDSLSLYVYSKGEPSDGEDADEDEAEEEGEI